jgi:hypothetical protein
MTVAIEIIFSEAARVGDYLIVEIVKPSQGRARLATQADGSYNGVAFDNFQSGDGGLWTPGNGRVTRYAKKEQGAARQRAAGTTG